VYNNESVAWKVLTVVDDCVVFISIYREQVNSKGAILEATVEYIHSLRKDQQKVNELQSRVEQLEAQQRKLLLQREVR